MKKVLIIGAGSYIGRFFASHAADSLETAFVGAANGQWRDISFRGYDSVLLAAGLAHRRPTPELKDLFFSVNRDLPISAAEKAKKEGVGQFVFLSSMAVYGVKTGGIHGGTIPNPDNMPNNWYGEAKLQAEGHLNSLQADDFQMAIIRPPLVYGPGCRGNFQTLVKLATTLPVAPCTNNRRSIIYIENLCELMRLIVEKKTSGMFHPQNSEYVDTFEMMRALAAISGNKLRHLKLLDFAAQQLGPYIPILEKSFGSLFYSRELSATPFVGDYNVVDFHTSLAKSMQPRI